MSEDISQEGYIPVTCRPLGIFPEWNYTIRPHDSVGKKVINLFLDKA